MRFFLVFFLLYGGIQADVAYEVIHAYGLAGQARLLVWLAALLMTLSPLLLRQLERLPGARIVAVIVALSRPT